MNPHVLLEVSTLAEAFATDIADVGTFAGVQSGVNHHFVSLSEGFVTKLTCVGSSVCIYLRKARDATLLNKFRLVDFKTVLALELY